MAASDEHPKHGEVLDEVLRDEIKDLPPEQIRQVLEYIGQLKEQSRILQHGQAPLLGVCLLFCIQKFQEANVFYNLSHFIIGQALYTVHKLLLHSIFDV